MNLLLIDKFVSIFCVCICFCTIVCFFSIQRVQYLNQECNTRDFVLFLTNQISGILKTSGIFFSRMFVVVHEIRSKDLS